MLMFSISVKEQDSSAAVDKHSRWIVQEGGGEGGLVDHHVFVGVQDAVESGQDARQQQGRQDGILAERTANPFHTLILEGFTLGRLAVNFTT